MTDDCRHCGPTTGPMTPWQRERIDQGINAVCDWLEAAAGDDECAQLAALATIERYLSRAESAHGGTVRMFGLVMYLARLCGRMLPDKFDQFGMWLIENTPHGRVVTAPDGHSIDEECPESRVSIRLMVAYANDNDRFAHELLVAFLDALPDRTEAPDHLQDVFLHLTEIYLWIQHHHFPGKDTHHVEHDNHSVAARVTAPWRRMAAAVAGSRRFQSALSALRSDARRQRQGRRERAGTRGRPGPR